MAIATCEQPNNLLLPPRSRPHSFPPAPASWPATTADLYTNITAIFVDNIRRDATTDCVRCIVDPGHFARTDIRFNLLKPTVDTLHWTTDESYTLDVHTSSASASAADTDTTMGNVMHTGDVVRISLNASTIFGLRHGLETLSQLMAHATQGTTSKTTVILNAIKITDAPAYTHRGLLLDTARNPLSVSDMERTLRGMAATKLNTLHWHATDTQSFSLHIPSVPAMAQLGGYSPSTIFQPADVRHLVEYARRRGVRVQLEIDAPSHVGNGWQWGQSQGLGNLTVCSGWQPWRQYCIQPPCGQLNPANGAVFAVLRKIYEALLDELPHGESVLHMGGDEVHFGCWNASAEVVERMGAKGWGRTTADFVRLWAEFQESALHEWTEAVADRWLNNGTAGAPAEPAKAILWSSHLTNPDTIAQYLPADRYVVQTWVPNTDDTPGRLLALGYEVIVSTKNAWYLDHGFWGSTAYYPWSKVYDNRIGRERGVLGGEACVWSELIDGEILDSRIWPRAAALGERLWSDPGTDARRALVRMYRMRERLVRMAGVEAEAVAPRWCVQNEGQCL